MIPCHFPYIHKANFTFLLALAIATLWIEFVREVRWCWEESQPLPRMPSDLDIDLSSCLIHQKLHLVLLHLSDEMFFSWYLTFLHLSYAMLTTLLKFGIHMLHDMVFLACNHLNSHISCDVSPWLLLAKCYGVGCIV